MRFDLPPLAPLPAQPEEKDWAFVEELRTVPYHHKVRLTRREPAEGEAQFPRGLQIRAEFPDPDGLLETAYADFRFFLQNVGIKERVGGSPGTSSRVGRSSSFAISPGAHEADSEAEASPHTDNAGEAEASPHAEGEFTLITREGETSVREEYRLNITPDRCELVAADTEGIRRGLVFLEDEILRRGGPFLPLGTSTRTPLVRTRISRCFYGPINRPPKCKDELADDVDYYPDEYLNRLAHEGVNVLWMTIHWYETIPSQLIPEYGQHAAPRLAKLRRTVEKCARYGIRIYPFCIEPAGFSNSAPEVAAAAAAHPELRGHYASFCTSSELGAAYVQEAVRTLFTEVPGLGGLIVIPVGERQTHCYSGSIPGGPMGGGPNTCPRCSKKQPYEVLRDTLALMRKGMDAVAPEAELVAWPYGQFISWGPEKTIEAAAHIPPGVILQHNFETGGKNKQLGKWHRTWDYWLSYAGPSEVFEGAASNAVSHGARASAKLQVGCSHEVATTQVVPAPGLLHRKYTAVHRLGVSSAMHSWYFGSYPSLMTRAAGELSFAPFAKRSRDFLLRLAQRDWGEHAETVVQAWQLFEKGYTNYPTAHIFGYFGPMHDGPAWPLYLVPRRLPLAPTWQIGYQPSGDYIAECICNGFTLDEVVTLCERMDRYWNEGVALLKGLRAHYRRDPERLRDIALATALGLQFRSGYHILRFYQLREKLAEATAPKTKQRLLAQMRELVEAELEVDEELLPLAEADARLGFHSEAEGYKYFPALLRWRMDQLRALLAEEFPQVEEAAAEPGLLFPEYVGAAVSDAVSERRGRASAGPGSEPCDAAGSALAKRDAGSGPAEARPLRPTHTGPAEARPLRGEPALQAVFAAEAPAMNGKPFGGVWSAAPEATCDNWLRSVYNRERWRKCGYDPCDHLPVDEEERLGRVTTWKALYTEEAIYVGVLCRPGESEASNKGAFAGNALQVYAEPVRTEPRRIFHISPDGGARCQIDDGYLPEADRSWESSSFIGKRGWSVIVRIPFAWLRPSAGSVPLRVNVVRSLPIASPGAASVSWAPREPVRGRLVWSTLNPATDFGWLQFGGGQDVRMEG